MVTAAEAMALNTAQVEAERDTFTGERYIQFARYLPADAKRILDVGCSTGRGGIALKSKRPDVSIFGLDCLQHRLDKLPDVYSGGVCSFTTAIDAPDDSFDAVVAGEFIEHVTYADGLKTIAEFHRVIRPGGRLLMTTPYPDYVRLVLTGRSTVGGAHLSAHYPKQLKVMMNDAGFRDVRWRPSGKMTRLFGERFPMWLYGSFLIWGDV
jgi:2-polyprenyl-3-methyl-5-hydroxy-6-metoxy-1,4-benzoquinol methylase